ncbi:MAG TPA: M67 family metallopeptidase [Vicinamibacterales bacterium]|nr:M67 family metallopeptidase [Vicinamibacterales bacterium]
MSGIRLSASAIAAIRRHGASAYPYEACGALIGATLADGDRDLVEVADVRPLDNVTEEGPRRRFLVRPSDYQQSELHARRVGAELLGFYHSHPDHPAQPSQYDLDHAWPNFSYVIISVRGGEPADLRSWRLRPDRSAFEEETQPEPAGMNDER